MSLNETIAHLRILTQTTPLYQHIGKVCKVSGLLVESQGPQCALGDLVSIVSPNDEALIDAEVIGFHDTHVLLMPLVENNNIAYGCRVVLNNYKQSVPIGDGLRGRIIDAFGAPMDKLGPLHCQRIRHFNSAVPKALERPIITRPFITSIKAIDTFIPMGLGQRMGIFAGSGVGKSTLLGMLAKHSEADINVLALIGERGRELNEFIHNDLGEEGLKKSVIVVATSDQAAPLRIRAAFLATYIAEFFRDCGKNVLLMMDSITRFAMAQREIGLSLGEPPTTRGYPPSVFGLLPKLLERAGRTHRGNITAVYTVLSEGDEFNEPISDAVRSILDGHIILSRALANANHYPAIDVLMSISRIAKQILSPEESKLVTMARNLLAIYKQNEDLISVGAYTPGHNQQLDLAVRKYNDLTSFLKQNYTEIFERNALFKELQDILLCN